MITHSIGANTFIIVRIMEPFWFMTGVITILPVLLAKQELQDVAIRLGSWNRSHEESMVSGISSPRGRQMPATPHAQPGKTE